MSLAFHLQDRSIYPTPVLVGRARGTAQGGGNVTIQRLAADMRRLRYSYDAVTSLVDFYGFRDKRDMSPDELIQAIHGSTGCGDDPLVFPYVQVHEFEGLLFSDVNAFGTVFRGGLVAGLRSVRDQFHTPEDINDDKNTAPSKRIAKVIKGYQKTLHGPLLADQIGLERIRRECPRFDAWLSRVESLG